MREVHVNDISNQIAQLCIDACHKLPEDVVNGFHAAARNEISPLGKSVLPELIDNDRIARENNVSYCHDTGLTIVYAKVGQDVHIVGGNYEDAVHAGVRKGYAEGFMRNSVVADPLLRVNSNDNTPAVIHTEIVPGPEIHLTVLPKGGGSENWSTMKFLLPGEGVEGVKNFVLMPSRPRAAARARR